MRFVMVSIALFAIVLAPLAVAQSPAPVREAVDVVLTEIPVYVFDRNGNPVRGLTRANFEVYEGRTRRAITHFDEIDLVELSARPREITVHPVAQRNFMLVFDLSSGSPGNLERAQAAARQFVEKNLAAFDLCAIASHSVDHGFRLLAAFTSDRRLLSNAVDSLEAPTRFRARDPLLLSALEDEGMENLDYQPASNKSDFETILKERQKQARAMAERELDAHERGRIRQRLEDFGQIARALDSISGRKQVILLSEGFDAEQVHGREQTGSREAIEENRKLETGRRLGEVDSDKRFGNPELLVRLEQMAAYFKRSDVVLHTFDIRGIRTDTDARAGVKPRTNESLFLLADSTGGHVFKNSNDMSDNFARLLRQQEVVYVLGFQTRGENDPSEFRELNVKLVGVAGARVDHRAGYYPAAARSTPLESMLSAADVLMKDIPRDDVRMSLLAGALAPRGADRALAQVVVEMDAASLLENTDRDEVNAEIFVYAFDRKNLVADYRYHTITLDLPKVAELLKSAAISYCGSLHLAPGDYTVKTLVRVSETGRMGFRRAELRVPEPSEAALFPPLFVDDARSKVGVHSRSEDAAGIAEFFAIGGERFVPAADPRVRNGERYKVVLMGSEFPEERSLRARVTDANGVSHPVSFALMGREPSSESGIAKLLFEFTPEALPAGAYELRFSTGDVPLSAAVPFVVQ